MRYYINKLLIMLLTVFLVSIIVFVMFQILPGNPVMNKVGIDNEDNTELIEKLKIEFHMDKPPAERYIIWISGILQGDMGDSFGYTNYTVRELIATRLPTTFTLAIASILLIVIVSVPLSIWIVTKQGSRFIGIFSAITQIGLALPQFWLALLLMILFGTILRWLPISKIVVDWSRPLLTIKGIIMPVLALSIGGISQVIRYYTSSILVELPKEYVDVVRAKGTSKHKVLTRHVLKNAFVPVLSVFGIIFISVLTGSVIIENVFGIAGIGSLLIQAVKVSDYPLIQGIVLYYSMITVSVHFVIDLLYPLIDPRMIMKRG